MDPRLFATLQAAQMLGTILSRGNPNAEATSQMAGQQLGAIRYGEQLNRFTQQPSALMPPTTPTGSGGLTPMSSWLSGNQAPFYNGTAPSPAAVPNMNAGFTLSDALALGSAGMTQIYDMQQAQQAGGERRTQQEFENRMTMQSAARQARELELREQAVKEPRVTFHGDQMAVTQSDGTTSFKTIPNYPKNWSRFEYNGKQYVYDPSAANPMSTVHELVADEKGNTTFRLATAPTGAGVMVPDQPTQGPSGPEFQAIPVKGMEPQLPPPEIGGGISPAQHNTAVQSVLATTPSIITAAQKGVEKQLVNSGVTPEQVAGFNKLNLLMSMDAVGNQTYNPIAIAHYAELAQPGSAQEFNARVTEVERGLQGGDTPAEAAGKVAFPPPAAPTIPPVRLPQRGEAPAYAPPPPPAPTVTPVSPTGLFKGFYMQNGKVYDDRSTGRIRPPFFNSSSILLTKGQPKEMTLEEFKQTVRRLVIEQQLKSADPDARRLASIASAPDDPRLPPNAQRALDEFNARFEQLYQAVLVGLPQGPGWQRRVGEFLTK